MCNSQIKFGLFWDKVDDSYDFVATGHYARIEHTPQGSFVYQAPDPIKDQSYFLSQLTQSQLKRILFPLGSVTKSQVREIAHAYDLVNKDRKDSQGICFLGKLKFKDFLKHYLGENPGQMVEIETGNVIGTHEGLWFYTVGQRQGLGLPGGPWYVMQKDIATNILYLSRHYYADDKLRNRLQVSNINWIGAALTETVSLQVKMRHGAYMHTALVVPNGDGTGALISLAERDQGIALGQFAVLYDNGRCLGGGVITHTW
jgi:tRNA-specific 2-thiouridylase